MARSLRCCGLRRQEGEGDCMPELAAAERCAAHREVQAWSGNVWLGIALENLLVEHEIFGDCLR